MKLFGFFLARGTFTFVITFIIFSLVRTHFFKEMKKHSNPKREFLISIFASYVVVMALFLFMPNLFISSHGFDLNKEHFDLVGDFKDRFSNGSWGVNIMPFKTIRNYIRYASTFNVFTNIFGNIAIFVPFGVLIPLIYKDIRNLKKVALLSASFSLLIEIIQFFVGRSVDIDDLLLNTLGGIVGYLIYKYLIKKKI